MYARLSNSTTVFHLSDQNNEVIAMQRDFGVRSSMIKKYYETRAIKALKALVCSFHMSTKLLACTERLCIIETKRGEKHQHQNGRRYKRNVQKRHYNRFIEPLRTRFVTDISYNSALRLTLILQQEKLEPLRPLKLWQSRIILQSNGTLYRTDAVIAEG